MIPLKTFQRYYLLITISMGENIYHPTPDRQYDHIHSVIDISVDLDQKTVKGNVEHQLSILSESSNNISFDTRDTRIDSVFANGEKITSFNIVKHKLVVSFSENYEMDDLIEVTIFYESKPKLGCYFVQPDSNYPNKRFQAWTQGEQMDNQHWVPLYDYPNDKGTFECLLTVAEPFTAISNGSLESITSHSNGKRTFHWKESSPMVSYLISFVVGEYQEIKVESPLVPISYWVYPNHSREDANRTFGHTPEMVKVFNDYLNFPYPFEKYDQIIVEDFMWGGMENITLSHMNDRTMHPHTAIPNYSSEWLVAHELAHQWFGNLITTRNWANIWLNEGLTSFMELIWAEHKYNYAEKEYYRLREVRSMKNVVHKNKPMVFFNYEDSNDLFDANVYAKGAVVMNMLRNYLGHKPFKKGLRFYTKENAYKNVESFDLKKSFEVTTGKNLYWFFNQWMYNPGLPKLTVEHKYSKIKGGTTITVEQTQDTTFSSVFRLPVVLLIDDGSINRFHKEVTKTKQTFFFPSKKPNMVLFDEGFQIPKFFKHKKSISELTHQLFHAPNVNDRIWAAEEMGKKKNNKKVLKPLFHALQNDDFWGVRKESAIALSKLNVKGKENKLKSIYTHESDDRVRSEILNSFKQSKEIITTNFLRDVILNEKNEYLVRSAINSLSKNNLDSLMSLMEFILQRESHNDMVRNSGIQTLSNQITEANFSRLMKLAHYGGTSWNSRIYAVRELEKFVKKYPEIMDTMVVFLEDPHYKVRWEAVKLICKYGGKNHLHQMLSITKNDPLTQMQYGTGKKYLKDRMEKRTSFTGSKKLSTKTLQLFYDLMNPIKKD